MEIGRINANPREPMVKASQSAPNVGSVFAVEFRKQERQEADVSNEERAARGLEDEENADPGVDDGDQGGAPKPSMQAKRTISFFA